MRQPNFNQIWSKCLGGKTPKAITYCIRDGSNFIHDIVFLSSLIHDARIKTSKIKLTGRKLILPLQRDCWELGLTKNNELHITDSVLIISGVKEVKWTSRKPTKTEIWLDYIWVSENYRKHDTDFFDLIFAGFEWRFMLSLDVIKWSIVLEDQGKPYLWSKKNKV